MSRRRLCVYATSYPPKGLRQLLARSVDIEDRSDFRCWAESRRLLEIVTRARLTPSRHARASGFATHLTRDRDLWNSQARATAALCLRTLRRFPISEFHRQ